MTSRFQYSTTPPTRNVMKFRNVSRNRNFNPLKLIFVFNICFLFLFCYIPSIFHQKQDVVIRSRSQIKQRAERVREICKRLNHEQFIEKEALFHADTINRLTNVIFKINDKNFHLCNILKGGSLSWKTFFKMNKIPHYFLSSCSTNNNTDSCSEVDQFTRLIQVRHPFVRLLSAWRHIFEAEGWKNLEMRFVNNQQLLEKGLKLIPNKTTYVNIFLSRIFQVSKYFMDSIY